MEDLTNERGIPIEPSAFLSGLLVHAETFGNRSEESRGFVRATSGVGQKFPGTRRRNTFGHVP
jgi:hypothetical protein